MLETPATDPTLPPPALPRVWKIVHRVEDVLIALMLAGIVVIPIAEAALRSWTNILNDWDASGSLPGLVSLFRKLNLPSGVQGANTLTQHFTLLIGMIGGAIAARESRLLCMTHGFAGARAPWGAIFETVRAGVSVGISSLLAFAGWQFFFSEKDSGRILVGHIPLWVPQVGIAIGFVIVAARLLIHAGRGAWTVRISAAILGAAIAALVLCVEPSSRTPATLLIGLLLLSVIVGAPIFVLLGGAAVFLFWSEGESLATIALDHYALSTNPTIPALPLFTLAGYFLAEGGTSRRMFRLLRSLVGGFHAGPALVTVIACAFFTSLTGASGVTILALGGLLVPFLEQARYSEREALGFFTCSGSVGMLFAPCLPLILYAIIAQVDMKAMFLGGVGPGVVFVIATIIWGAIRRPRRAATEVAWDFSAREAAAAAWDAKWELLIPFVSLGTIFSGIATPVEASAMTALFALFTQTVIYRDLKPRELLRVMRECGMLMGGVLLMLGVAQAFTNYLVYAEIPTLLVDLVKAHVTSPLVFIALLNVVLLLVGCVMEVFQAIIVVAPLVVPVGLAFGMSPVHLGILFLANLELGFMMPPVGMNLVLTSFRFRKSMGEVLRAVFPFLWPQFAVVLLVSYWPALSTWLPGLFGYEAP